MSAGRDPERFFIGIDPNRASLVRYSRKIGRKPAKGGLPNALYVLAAVETLTPELEGVADRVTVLFPWGSLLRTVALADLSTLNTIRRLCQTGATLEIALAYHEALEASEVARLGLPQLLQDYLEGELAGRYREAGFDVREVKPVRREELRTLPSTWARRLACGRARDVWRLRAQALS